MRLRTIFPLALAIALAVLPAPRAQENSQNVEQKRECGTEVSAEQITVEQLRASRLAAPSLAPQPNIPYQLPLTIHIVRRSDGAGGFALDLLRIAMQDLNRLWRPFGVQFFIYGAIDYINSDTHFDVPDTASRNALRRVNPVSNTINIYFTNLVNLCGEATYTSSSVQGVLIDNGCAGVANNPSAIAHEIGHYFDLYHTHETRFGVECPGGSNCSSAGDKLCDTPADPNRYALANCVYDGTAEAPANCDDTPYNPPIKNVMSYAYSGCVDRFTTGQINKVLSVLTEDRSNLINSFTKYVASNASASNQLCTYQAPCRTINLAVNAAKSGDHIFINPGIYPLTSLSSSKRVFLENRAPYNGVVHIEQ